MPQDNQLLSNEDYTMKAVYDIETRKLTFYYDDDPHGEGVMFDVPLEETEIPQWIYADIVSVEFDQSFASARPTTCYRWFSGKISITSISGMQYLNTSEVTNMINMFYMCESITSLDVSGFDTSKVTTMQQMFSGCTQITFLDVSNWNVSSVTDMYGIFMECTALAELDVSNWNTSNVIDMGGMFCLCSSIDSLNLSSFDTSKVTSMSFMFAYTGCNLNLSTFNTSSLIDASGMFAGCTFTSLNIEGFTKSAIARDEMFYECSELTTIYSDAIGVTGKWQASSSSGMFYGCVKLPNYSSSDTGVSKAYIGDGGYFTLSDKYKLVYLASTNQMSGNDQYTDGTYLLNTETYALQSVDFQYSSLVDPTDKGSVAITDLLLTANDYVNTVQKVKHVTWGYKILTGTETPTPQETGNTVWYQIDNIAEIENVNCYSTHYKKGTDGSYYIKISNSSGSWKFAIHDETNIVNGSITEWNTFVTSKYSSSDPIIIFYPYKTPVNSSATSDINFAQEVSANNKFSVKGEGVYLLGTLSGIMTTQTIPVSDAHLPIYCNRGKIIYSNGTIESDGHHFAIITEETPTSQSFSREVPVNMYGENSFFDIQSGEYYINSALKVLTGSEGWETSDVFLSENYATFYLNISDMAETSLNPKCTHFNVISAHGPMVESEGIHYGDNKYIYIRIKRSIASTTGEFKAYLINMLNNNSPVMFTYDLETPTSSYLPHEEITIRDMGTYHGKANTSTGQGDVQATFM